MTKKELYKELKEKFQKVLDKHEIGDEEVCIQCRSLSPEEAIGITERKDFPIITGKDVMIQAQFKNSFGQAFTDAPSTYSGTLSDILKGDLENDSHARGLFIATMNAVMKELGYCCGTVHCRTEGPEKCAQDMLAYLNKNYGEVQHIALIGYQPSLLERLSKSKYHVRVFDLNANNIGQERYGVVVEDGGMTNGKMLKNWADLILCTGSTLCNGTIVDYMDLDTKVLFFGITLAGAAPLLGFDRVCFADQYC